MDDEAWREIQMTLTPAQLEQRTRGIGASEIAAIADVHPFKYAANVWVTKRRGKDLERPPLIAGDVRMETEDPDDDLDDELPPTEVGNAIEYALRDIYNRRSTGLKMVPGTGTLVHPDVPWAMATPDGFVVRVDETLLEGATFSRGGWLSRREGADYLGPATIHRGGELKAVGTRMAHEWRGGCPRHVFCQAQWGMYVTDLSRWDVVAFIGGTRFVIHRLERDDDTIQALHEAGERFWVDNVLGDTVPMNGSGASVRQAVSSRWALENGDTIVAPAAAAPLATLAAELDEDIAKLADQRDKLYAKLCELLAESRSMTGPWGRFTHYSKEGPVLWKAIATELAAGRPIPDEMYERNRGRATRVPLLTPWKGRKT